MAIQEVASSNTKNQGRNKWNANDLELESRIDTVEDAHAQHIGNGHPSLYHTKSEINSQQAAQDAAIAAQTAVDEATITRTGDGKLKVKDSVYLTIGYLSSLMRTTTDQVFDGIKSFLKNPIVKNENPGVELIDKSGPDEAQVGKLSGGGGLANDRFFGLMQFIAGDYKWILRSDKQGKVDFPRTQKISVQGNDLATEKYVQERVKNGVTYMFAATASLSNESAVLWNYLVLPTGSRLLGVKVAIYDEGAEEFVGTIAGTFNIGSEYPLLIMLNNTTATGCKLSVQHREPTLGIFEDAVLDLGSPASGRSFKVTITIGI